MPRKCLPAVVNRSRFETSSDAVKMMIRIFENSPGWMLNSGVRI
jgi:hypothetical protein